MPYNQAQRKLFNAEAHDPEIAREHGTSHAEATKLADEANKLKKEGREKHSSTFIDLTPVFGAASANLFS